MALKDWKQTNESSWKNIANYQYLTIIKMNRLKRLPIYFIYIYDYRGSEKTVKKFATKSQALAYAKAYMKKH